MQRQYANYKLAKEAYKKGFTFPLEIFNSVYDLGDEKVMHYVHRDSLLACPGMYIFAPELWMLLDWVRREGWNVSIDAPILGEPVWSFEVYPIGVDTGSYQTFYSNPEEPFNTDFEALHAALEQIIFVLES